MFTERSARAHFDGLMTKRLLTYCDFTIHHFKNTQKSHVFVKFEKHAKIRILQHWGGDTPSRSGPSPHEKMFGGHTYSWEDQCSLQAARPRTWQKKTPRSSFQLPRSDF